MSNFRKVIKRRDHYERSQPASRAKVGFLEKKVDYQHRSKVFHAKEDRLQALRAQARNRNADEYYHRMSNQHEHTDRSGRHIIARKSQVAGEAMTGERLKLLKTQDRNYLLLQAMREQRSISRAKSALSASEAEHGLNRDSSRTNQDGSDEERSKDHEIEENEEGIQQRRHVIFTDAPEKLQDFNPVQHFETLPELVDKPLTRLRVEQLQQKPLLVNPVTAKEVAKLERARASEMKKLAFKVKRAEKIEQELKKLETQRNLMGKGKRVMTTVRDKFGDIDESRTVFRWALQRKK